MAEKKKFYWDACIWFALIKHEPGRFAKCEHVLGMARRGEVEIWTSSLTLAEVFRKQCGGTETSSLPADKDREFEDFVAQDFVVEVQLDHLIGITARRLLRTHLPLKKPPDAVHLASAVWHDLDEFHTFDAVNLLCLNGLVTTRSGRPLKICEPPDAPPDLFTETASEGITDALVPGSAPAGLVELSAGASSAAASVQGALALLAPIVPPAVEAVATTALAEQGSGTPPQ